VFLGLRTLIVPAPDLDASKRWYAELLGREPYFDQPFYVGFNVGGYELGLDPNAPPQAGPVTYWGVADADAGLTWLLGHGAKARGEVTDVGDGIRVATVIGGDGLVIGIIENPHFTPAAEDGGEGPGR
jgi:catechol 2,3-dioxygenase-like lactoylglutathione lyase family enzyme